jgi:hypothetical protein
MGEKGRARIRSAVDLEMMFDRGQFYKQLYLPIFFCNKITKPNCKKIKAVENTFGTSQL